MGKLIQGGLFIADVDIARGPAPIANWLEKELPNCTDIQQVAKGIWEEVNRILKKDADQYLFQLVGNVFSVFKNGKKVVEVKQLPND